MEILHGEFLGQFLVAKQLDDVYQFLVSIQGLTQIQQFLFVVQCSDLLGKQFRIVCGIHKQLILDCLDVLLNFLLGLENVPVSLKFVPKFCL